MHTRGEIAEQGEGRSHDEQEREEQTTNNGEALRPLEGSGKRQEHR